MQYIRIDLFSIIPRMRKWDSSQVYKYLFNHLVNNIVHIDCIKIKYFIYRINDDTFYISTLAPTSLVNTVGTEIEIRIYNSAPHYSDLSSIYKHSAIINKLKLEQYYIF